MNKTEIQNFIEETIKANSYKVEYKKTNEYELSEVELSDVAEIIANKITENN